MSAWDTAGAGGAGGSVTVTWWSCFSFFARGAGVSRTSREAFLSLSALLSVFAGFAERSGGAGLAFHAILISDAKTFVSFLSGTSSLSRGSGYVLCDWSALLPEGRASGGAGRSAETPLALISFLAHEGQLVPLLSGRSLQTLVAFGSLVASRSRGADRSGGSGGTGKAWCAWEAFVSFQWDDAHHAAGVALHSRKSGVARRSWKAIEAAGSVPSSFSFCPVASWDARGARRSIVSIDARQSWISWKTWQTRRASHSFETGSSVLTAVSLWPDRPWRTLGSLHPWESHVTLETRKSTLTLSSFDATAVAFSA